MDSTAWEPTDPCCGCPFGHARQAGTVLALERKLDGPFGDVRTEEQLMVGPARCRRGWSGVQAFPVGLHPASSSTHAATAGGRRPGLPNRTHCLCCYLMDRCQDLGLRREATHIWVMHRIPPKIGPLFALFVGLRFLPIKPSGGGILGLHAVMHELLEIVLERNK